MHWTAFLAYRRFPAHARMMEDCACIQCGYNLRMQMVSARCPECGYEVGHSVFLLAKPSVAARGLRSAGASYLAPLAMIVPLLFATYWALFVVSLAATAGAVFRVVGTSDLRINAAIARLPVVGSRLNLWWTAAILDVVVCGGWCIAMIVISNSLNLQTTGVGWSIVIWCIIAWWFSTIFSAWAAGRFGYALMDMLNYTWTRIEFRVQHVAVIFVFVLGPFFIIGFKSIASPGMLLALEWTLAALTAIVMLATAIPLLHSATACEESAESWDDLIDSERIVMLPESQRPRRPEPPAIKVEGG